MIGMNACVVIGVRKFVIMNVRSERLTSASVMAGRPIGPVASDGPASIAPAEPRRGSGAGARRGGPLGGAASCTWRRGKASVATLRSFAVKKTRRTTKLRKWTC